MMHKHDYIGLEASPGERSAWSNGYEEGLVAGVTTGIEQKLLGIQSIIDDKDLSDKDVRMLLKHMCEMELIHKEHTT